MCKALAFSTSEECERYCAQQTRELLTQMQPHLLLSDLLASRILQFFRKSHRGCCTYYKSYYLHQVLLV